MNEATLGGVARISDYRERSHGIWKVIFSELGSTKATTMIDFNPLTEWFTMWREIIPALIAAAKWVMDQVNRGDPR